MSIVDIGEQHPVRPMLKSPVMAAGPVAPGRRLHPNRLAET
jgi:hypothetical protein